ncbi:GFA family protein [Uliginosibacterium gangwonense]|uniref:GFA family protein n=1 Tax=Uliginosibacterium gangwonense TaxID=392736 RepID=UPI0003753518|nr:GFA family protein [Uliginosibacterium gangwonense]
MHYKGSCHCGQIAFEVEGELTQAIECNCSICTRKAALMWFVPKNKFRLLTPEAHISTYTFGQHRIQHRFCPTCGIHPFGEGIDPAGNHMVAINVRCLENIELAALPVKHFDGRAL